MYIMCCIHIFFFLIIYNIFVIGADEAEAEKMVSSLRIPEERNSAVKLQPHEMY